MSDYGFTIKVNDLTSAQMKQIENSIKSLGGTVNQQTNKMQEDFGNLGESAKSLRNILIEAFSIYEIYNFGKELLHLTAEFQGFENVIKYSSDGIVDTSQNMNYLNDAIVRMHLPMKETYEAFSEMQAGFYGTGIEGEKLRKVFEGVSEAATVLHLAPAKFSNVTFALKEIGELGTLQARQMRMLAFALPGAMNLAAKSMGMTTEELHEAMKKGQIQSSVFLPKFAETLTEHFHPGLANAGNSLLAQINDEKNSIIKLMLDMGTTLEPFFLEVLHTISYGMQEIKKVWDSLAGNPAFVNTLKTIFEWVAKLVPIWIAYELVIKASSLATMIFSGANEALAGAMATATGATEEAEAAIASFNAVLDASLIGGVVTAIGLLVEHLISTNEQLDKLIDKTGHFSQSNRFFSSQSDIAAKISEQYRAALAGGKPDKEALQSVANQIAQYNAIQRDSIGVIKLRDSLAQANASVQHPKGAWQRFREGGIDYLMHDAQKAIIDSANHMKAHVEQNKIQTDTLNKIGAAILTKFKIKPTITDYKNPGSASKENALNTSNLAGANGGLGSSKIIQIHIGVVQQNNGVKESKSVADQAVQQLLRELNNVSDSQNSM